VEVGISTAKEAVPTVARRTRELDSIYLGTRSREAAADFHVHTDSDLLSDRMGLGDLAQRPAEEECK